MLGRLVDQQFEVHNADREDSESWEALMRHYHKSIDKVKHEHVWGDMLEQFWSADARIINLETSVTSSNNKWPGKAFNYRMHPHNVKALKVAKIDFCSLANNHTLDYGNEGLEDTVRYLTEYGIQWAGVGNNIKEARKPAIISLGNYKIACFSFADHYSYWAATESRPGINYINPSDIPPSFFDELNETVQQLKANVCNNNNISGGR
eukprot:TRINITY_DN3938_c0_g1_i9.p1 TRINITY_DN3938_c0_g1~~TRINITY_DN3938_c0_g1_i9.p1  ORF type:complete len:231 (-),score=27.18 TRINITY_DN3938_c0_g1_i9:19-639(-)